MPRGPARLLVAFVFAAVGCSTINLKGTSSGANWHGSDEAQIRSQPGWVKVDQHSNGKGMTIEASAVAPR